LICIDKKKQMKTIIICRHAKSSWDTVFQADVDRTLNDRGNADAPKMAAKLLARNIPLDSIISSSAKRAAQTAAYMAAALLIDAKQLVHVDELYHAPPHVIDDVIASQLAALNTIMIVCHNPGITHWVNEQTTYLIDNMPTCGMMAFSADVNDWLLFATAKKEVVFFDYPKNVS
jgi:phosphohistidine phosphatase